MNVEMITREDLQNLKTELLSELKSILTDKQPETKGWLRSGQVRKMLSISPGTLQNLRINGQLRYTKIGGSFFYKYEDISAMLSGKRAKR